MIDYTETRVKVVALYPNCPFSLGEVLCGKLAENLLDIQDNSHAAGHIAEHDRLSGAQSKFPANFERLRWWEDRKEKELPSFIKLSRYPTTRNVKEDPVVFEVAKNVNGTKSIFIPAEGSSFYERATVAYIDGGETKLDCAMYFYPATEEEFNEQFK